MIKLLVIMTGEALAIGGNPTVVPVEADTSDNVGLNEIGLISRRNTEHRSRGQHDRLTEIRSLFKTMTMAIHPKMRLSSHKFVKFVSSQGWSSTVIDQTRECAS